LSPTTLQCLFQIVSFLPPWHTSEYYSLRSARSRNFRFEYLHAAFQIGYLRQRCSCCSSSFYVNNADDQSLMRVSGPCWCCTCGCDRLCCGCCDIDFTVKK
uniref:Phospholipid scramblase n=1 Tax=Heligmosomoides polygyrus TaxID=6339 RepID=A0A183F309_HELPZ